MTIRLTLLCAHPADTSAQAVFGHTPDSGYAPHAVGAALAALRPHSWAVCSPAAGSAQTAAALGLTPTAEPALRDIDYGAWRGRAVADVVAADPHGYSAWLTDPDASPHGGETVRLLCHRTANWLDSVSAESGRALVIAEPAVIRALLVHALSAPVRAFWRLQVSPPYTVCLTRHAGGWSVQPAYASPAHGVVRRPPLPRGPLPEHRRPVGHRGTYVCSDKAASFQGGGSRRKGTAA